MVLGTHAVPFFICRYDKTQGPKALRYLFISF